MIDHDVGVTIALALATGMVAQALASHLKLPGIVLLLAAGVLLGPDVLGFIRPDSLGSALQVLVGFAVAVILFEGGLNLSLSRLAHEAKVIRRLLTVGVVVTAVGGAVAARGILGWDWRLSVLFGTLVVVTGPTVITPLLRRIKVQHNVGTVLEAEGVLIDPIGAALAVVALEVVISLTDAPRLEHTAAIPLHLFARLGFGLVCGMTGGLLLAQLLRFERVIPEGLGNVFTLSLVLALYQLSDAILSESGIMTVTIAGVVMGNLPTRAHRDLMEFKEQLTVLFIGMLFVLLAADVRIDDVRALGWPGVATVLVLMVVVRPLNVALSTWGSNLTWKQRGFLAWLAPRGIIAAAVASLFAQTLTPRGIAGGEALQALVFLVIAVTVLVQGLSGGLVARILGLRRAVEGYAILGANELGHALGRLLRDSGEDVVFLDSNPSACHVVEQDGFKVVFGNVMAERSLHQARLEDRAACISVTANEEANLLFGQKAIDEFKVARAYLGITRDGGVTAAAVRKAGGSVLFGVPRDLELWALRFRRKTAAVESWRLATLDEPASPEGTAARIPLDTQRHHCLPLVVERGDKIFPANDRQGVRVGDVVRMAVFLDQRDEARAWLAQHGWEPVDPGPVTDPSGDPGDGS